MDIVGALVAYIGVTVIDTVYGDELPQEQVPNMPAYRVVVRMAGGGGIGGGDKAYGDQRIDVDCYGPTPLGAWELYEAVRYLLSRIDRLLLTVDGNDVLVHWCRETVRGITGREPDTEWPTCMSTWQVLAWEEQP